ncbi:MAG: hypothetical protein ABWX61_11235 [Paenisporosarcina sp.]
MKNIGYRLKSMIKLFQLEPLWFKVFISITLLTSIVFSSSYFSHDSMYDGISKLAVAIFFIVYGYKMNMNRKVSMIFYALAGLCLVLALLAFINN